MKILERILALGIVLGLIMKFSLTPGGDVIVLLTMLTLSCVYYPLGFLFFNQIKLRYVFKAAAYKGVAATSIILAIVTGIGLSIIVIGSLFKFLHFMGGDQMLILGLVITAIVFAMSLTRWIKDKDTKSKFVLWRTGTIGVIGTFLFFTPELSLVKFQYRNHPKYIEAYANYVADPTNEALFRKMELERMKIRLTGEELKRYEESVNGEAGN